jgi:transposase
MKESRTGVQGQGGISCNKREKALSELAEHFDVHPKRISEWKQQLLESAPDVFGGTSKVKAAEPDLKVLLAKIGQLTLENDFLEGALTKAGLLSAKK